MIEHTDRVNIKARMVVYTRASGKLTNKKAMAKRSGLMAPTMKESTRRVSNVAMVPTNGLIILAIEVTGMII